MKKILSQGEEFQKEAKKRHYVTPSLHIPTAISFNAHAVSIICNITSMYFQEARFYIASFCDVAVGKDMKTKKQNKRLKEMAKQFSEKGMDLMGAYTEKPVNEEVSIAYIFIIQVN